MENEKAGGRRRVVVLGGGVAGSLVAKSLEFVADVTLVDPKEYFEIPWAALRVMVEPSFGEQTVINHREYLTNGTVVTSHAVNITETEVVTADGRGIAYDFLVVATGHSESVPGTRSERLDQYKSEYEKIRSARSILIVGGGPTGVELAGEIATDFPEKKVTIVHRGTRLLEFIGPKASDKALKWLISKKVEVKLGKSLNLDDADGSKNYRTSDGGIIQADCHFLCIGKPLGTDWLKNTVLKSSLDKHGRVVVDANLRVRGKSNIFAIGDINDTKDLKQGYVAQAQADLAAKNIKLLIEGGNGGKLKTYKTQYEMALVSLGRKDGLAQFPFTTMRGKLIGYLKSRDLFVGRTRKLIGLQTPKYTKN